MPMKSHKWTLTLSTQEKYVFLYLVTDHNFARSFLLQLIDFIQHHQGPPSGYDDSWSFAMQFDMRHCELDHPGQNVQRDGRSYGLGCFWVRSRHYHAALQQEQKDWINLTQTLRSMLIANHGQGSCFDYHHWASCLQEH